MRLLFFLFLSMFHLSVFAQGTIQNGDSSDTLNSYLSGRIYMVYRNEVPIFWEDRFELSPTDFPELVGLKDYFGIEKIENSFFFADDEFLSRTMTVFFTHENMIEQLLDTLKTFSTVRLVERIPMIKTGLVPDDSMYDNQWSLTQVNAEQAWDITTGSSQIKIAIVDDAIQTNHPDLSDVIFSSYDASTGGNNAMPPTELYDHGTHVAGIASAESNNAFGVASIGFGNIQLIAIKASDGTPNPDGPGVLITHSYQGVVWAAQNGANIINCSWGSYSFSSVHQQTINSVSESAIIVAAAGNDNITDQLYPAAYDNVIAVASSNQTDQKSDFSNYGNWITVTAPGTSIMSTVINGSYWYNSGTSMASPLVTGLLGLVWSANLNLTKESVVDCVLNSALNVNWSGSGSGRINALGAVLCAQSGNVWVDQNYSGFENGAFTTPYNTLMEGVDAVTNGGSIYIKSSSSSATPLIDVNKTFMIRTWNGSSSVGVD